jgi:hypothetical protein
MQRRTSGRTVFSALAVLTAMIIGMLSWSPAASAEQRHGQSHGRQKHVAQKHVAQKHLAHKDVSRKHVAQKHATHQNGARVMGQQGKAAANAKSPLDTLLDGLLGANGVAGAHGPVSKIVNDTVPKAVKKTVDSTTGVVNTALGRGTSTGHPTKPPTPTSTTSNHTSTPTHASATHPASNHAAGPSTASATHDSAATVRIAPLDSPALVAVKHPAGEKAGPPAEVEPPRPAALTPASLLSAPGTGILVGLMFAFAAGVFAVVYGGGYRGRRAR